MAKKQATQQMKIKDPKIERDSRYAQKHWNQIRKGIFKTNSPFNPKNHSINMTSFSGDIHITSISVRSDNDGLIDRMIVKNRGEHHNGNLPPTKFEITERE